MNKEDIKKIKFLQSRLKKIGKGNVFEEYMYELYKNFEKKIQEKYPESSKFQLITKIEDPEMEKKFMNVVFSDAEKLLSQLTKEIDQNKELINELKLSEEVIDFAENIKALIQIVTNYYIIKDKEKYIKELKENGLDIEVIIAELFDNFNN